MMKKEIWLLDKPKTEIYYKNTLVKEEILRKLVNEVVGDVINPYGMSGHQAGQYKKLEKYDHLLHTIVTNVRQLTDSVKQDLENGYLEPKDAQFLVNDYFERAIDSISYAGSSVLASLESEEDENY